MHRRLHLLIAEAKREADAYRVKPNARGLFNVWRFRSWDLPNAGWSVIIANLATRETAEAKVLERLGLEPAKPAPPPVLSDPYFTTGYFDFGA